MSFSFFQADSKTSSFSWEECEGRGARSLRSAEGMGAGLTGLQTGLHARDPEARPAVPREGRYSKIFTSQLTGNLVPVTRAQAGTQRTVPKERGPGGACHSLRAPHPHFKGLQPHLPGQRKATRPAEEGRGGEDHCRGRSQSVGRRVWPGHHGAAVRPRPAALGWPAWGPRAGSVGERLTRPLLKQGRREETGELHSVLARGSWAL